MGELAVQQPQVMVTRSEPFTLENQREFLQSLISSGKIPVKSVEEAFTIAQYGRELGFSPLVSFSYVLSVQGRLTLSVKAMKALLLKGGVTWKTIYDGAYLYADGTVEEYQLVKDGNKPIDMISRIEFTRKIGDTVMTEIGTFTHREAITAGLVKATGAWVQYKRQMLSSRAFSNGADKIASDLLLGMYSADELVSVQGVDESRIVRNADGEVEQILDAEVVK